MELIFLDDGEPSVAIEELAASSASIEAARPLLHESPSSRKAPSARDAPSGASHDSRTESAATRAETSNSLTPHLPGARSGAPAPAEANEPVNGGAPLLSLDQLGVGGPSPFRSLVTEAPPPKQDANQRLQASLRQGSLERDRQRALGPEGPVLRAAHQLVSANEVLIETSAIVDVRVDAAGRVASVHLSSASSQTEDWRKLAESLVKSLGAVRLRRAGESPGFDFKVRLASTMQLPSGASPGVRLGLLGQTLREAGGPKSTSLSLSPTAPLQSEPVFDTSGRHQDHPMQFELGLLKLKGDVGDIAAGPRRVVQITVLASNAVNPP